MSIVELSGVDLQDYYLEYQEVVLGLLVLRELGHATKRKRISGSKTISHRRVRIEHIICSIKRCRIVKDTIRLWKDTARDLVRAICCGLHNFRVRLHPWQPDQ
jgi:hypothetical protein